MSIRRKSTAHDLATLRLHPDGSRVQQSTVNAKQRTTGYTVVDSRGNWIAKDAGGKSSVKTRRQVSVHADDVEREFIDLSGEEDARDKGKQRARDNQTPEEEEPEAARLNARTRRRLSFMNDLSFLDPNPVSISTLEEDSDEEPGISFSDPASDLLKSIHHFTSCYYRERGQLSDRSRNYRGKKKERYKQSQENIHIFAATAPEEQDIETETETEHTESEDETTTEEDEVEVRGTEEQKAKVDSYKKDMYKAFDGSALMAIGIVLQEYVAGALSSKPRTSDELRSPKRRRTELDEDDNL